MAFQPVWVKKVISKKCDYQNKDICMPLQMVNAGVGIGQVLEMLANELRTHFDVAQCCKRIYIVEQNQQLRQASTPFHGMVFMP